MLSPFRLAFAGGILAGLSILVLTLISVSNGYAREYLTILSSIFPQYEISSKGSLIGFAYGFAWGFVNWLIFGVLYNVFGCCSKCKK